jgi:hypothetical protein
MERNADKNGSNAYFVKSKDVDALLVLIEKRADDLPQMLMLASVVYEIMRVFVKSHWSYIEDFECASLEITRKSKLAALKLMEGLDFWPEK